MLVGYKEQHIREVFDDVPKPANRATFYNCTFNKLNGAVLKDCVLQGSKLAMTKPEDIIGLTLTMDCNTFRDVELSPEVFDLMLLLLCRTKGNNAKRLAIIEKVVGHDRSIELLKDTERLER
jgi:hypothetical protein